MQVPENSFFNTPQKWQGLGVDPLGQAFVSRLSYPAKALRTAQEQATAGQLALEMIHEITNPLEALGHLTYLALEEANNAEKVRTYLRLAEEQLATLRHITSQTLEFARTSRSPKSIDLIVLVEAAIRIHQRTIDSKKVHVHQDFCVDAVVKVCTGEMLQVISNLMANALDALTVEGSLYLRLSKGQGRVYFMLVDNGSGVPREDIAHIFEAFFTTKGERGTGLGLGMSKTIVESHQGSIRVRSSVEPGRSGTVFRISLPGLDSAMVSTLME